MDIYWALYKCFFFAPCLRPHRAEDRGANKSTVRGVACETFQQEGVALLCWVDGKDGAKQQKGGKVLYQGSPACKAAI